MKLDLLRKIRALREQGDPGERENADAILRNLLTFYGLTEEQFVALAEEDICEIKLGYGTKHEERLIYQILVHVTTYDKVKVYTLGSQWVKIIEGPKQEMIVVAAMYSFYKEAYKRKLDLFFEAFIQTNNIYHNESWRQRSTSIERDEDREREVLTLSAAIQRDTFYKALRGRS